MNGVQTMMSDDTKSTPQQEMYLLQLYKVAMGPQAAAAETYFADALLPALGRLGLGPVGAFRVEVGENTPAYYLLIPARSPLALVTLERELSADAEFVQAGEPFLRVGGAAVRMETSLLQAFTGWPRVIPPDQDGPGRIFQLRRYVSPTEGAHALKVEMFNEAEIALFQTIGFRIVFFGDTLVGPQKPNLTYMLTFANRQEMEEQWAAFVSSPAWKELSTSEKYGAEPLLSSISNLLLSRLPCSQI